MFEYRGLNKKEDGYIVTIFFFVKRETGFEPATLALARRYSTTEPLAHILFLLCSPRNDMYHTT